MDHILGSHSLLTSKLPLTVFREMDMRESGSGVGKRMRETQRLIAFFQTLFTFFVMLKYL